jgi:hypothetical protein
MAWSRRSPVARLKDWSNLRRGVFWAIVLAAALLITLATAIALCSGQKAVVAHSVVTTSPVTTSPVTSTTATSTPRATPSASATTREVAPVRTTPVASAPPPVPRLVRVDHLAKSAPVRLQIASIGLDSSLMRLGLRSDGSMQVPPGGFPAGWFTGGPTPGERGPAVIAGHIDMSGPGVFYHLANVRPGDWVMVTRADGSRPVFRVARVSRYQKDQFPTKLVYGNINHPGLRLITCGGTFNAQTGHYEENLVVFADLIGTAR